MMTIKILLTMWRELAQYLSIVLLKFALWNMHICHSGIIENAEDKRGLKGKFLDHYRIIVRAARGNSVNKERNTHVKQNT